ncbi:hypothetical protein SBA4_3730012 [Candidatus Sulfopaludibacter sp. SbA4]|nr:hypothetical protein SBA4_3730012 [Candidatus Sulfopaludibacter sp. SbA4]
MLFPIRIYEAVITAVTFDRNKAVSSAVNDTIRLITDLHQDIRVRIGQVTSGDKREHLPLQAADILAYESMKFRDNKIQGLVRPRKSRERLNRNNWVSIEYTIKEITEVILQLMEHRYAAVRLWRTPPRRSASPQVRFGKPQFTQDFFVRQGPFASLPPAFGFC